MKTESLLMSEAWLISVEIKLKIKSLRKMIPSHPKTTSTDFSKGIILGKEVKRLAFILCIQCTRSFNNYSARLNHMKEILIALCIFSI